MDVLTDSLTYTERVSTMDQSWISPYLPTRPTEPGDPVLSPQDLESLRDRLIELTRQIGRYPYNVTLWVRRADVLSQLKYPESAAGDAWKAGFLAGKMMEKCEERHDGREARAGNDEVGGRWKLGFKMGFWMREADVKMEDAADDEGGSCFEHEGHYDFDENDYRWQRLSDLREEARYLQNKNLYYYPQFEEGRYYSRLYPWMEARHRYRDDQLLETINAEFEQQARDKGRGTADCVIRRHAFGRSSNSEMPSDPLSKPTSDILGVFATHDIPAHTTLILDKTRTWGCIGPGTGSHPQNLANLHGGMGCSDPIHPKFPEETVEQDLRWIRDRCGKEAAGVLLLCRLLGETLQKRASEAEEDNEECQQTSGGGSSSSSSTIKHPLDHPLLARLTPTYRRTKIQIFSLEEDIIIPNLFLLQTAGIDIFASPQYETWTLFELAARSRNNSWSNPLHSCISPLFSLFNHSCEPNVSWEVGQGNCTSMRITTSRAIEEGEQFFVLYDGYMADEPLKARRKRMRRWLDAECLCGRCVREEATEAAAEVVEEEEVKRMEGALAAAAATVQVGAAVGDGAGKVDSPMSSRRTSPIPLLSGAAAAIAGWDTAPSIVFPEDQDSATGKRPTSSGSSG
ncbi:hypothetical protein LTS14_009245 [Recurvomyces mirabilis]|uniref:uncharacterized protein n=1 Tax=Recurvomyces mirabilis TaxID=574656 RepID=UPI002DDDFADA|nr:hypothetical protein LTS14_009245 [Recurvomyces mirabilis]